MVCVFVFVCLWGSTFAGLAFCATLSMTKLIIIIITTCSDRTRAWSAIRHFNPRPYDKKEKIRWKTFAIGG